MLIQASKTGMYVLNAICLHRFQLPDDNVTKQIYAYDAKYLQRCGWLVPAYENKYISGTGSMGAFGQAMALNAGQLLVFYDEPDNFKRAHGICPGGIDAMSTTLSMYDGATASRLFIEIDIS